MTKSTPRADADPSTANWLADFCSAASLAAGHLESKQPKLSERLMNGVRAAIDSIVQPPAAVVSPTQPTPELNIGPIVQAVRNAPKAPWRLELKDPLYGYYTVQTADEGRIAEVWGDEGRAQFIVDAPIYVCQLIAEVRRLRKVSAVVSPREEPKKEPK